MRIFLGAGDLLGRGALLAAAAPLRVALPRMACRRPTALESHGMRGCRRRRRPRGSNTGCGLLLVACAALALIEKSRSPVGADAESAPRPATAARLWLQAALSASRTSFVDVVEPVRLLVVLLFDEFSDNVVAFFFLAALHA